MLYPYPVLLSSYGALKPDRKGGETMSHPGISHTEIYT